jgi:pyruvate dehydrogenase complex dehydrogenase (E1) component
LQHQRRRHGLALQARRVLAQLHDIDAAVFSVTSYQQLRRDARSKSTTGTAITQP